MSWAEVHLMLRASAEWCGQERMIADAIPELSSTNQKCRLQVSPPLTAIVSRAHLHGLLSQQIDFYFCISLFNGW